MEASQFQGSSVLLVFPSHLFRFLALRESAILPFLGGRNFRSSGHLMALASLADWLKVEHCPSRSLEASDQGERQFALANQVFSNRLVFAGQVCPQQTVAGV